MWWFVKTLFEFRLRFLRSPVVSERNEQLNVTNNQSLYTRVKLDARQIYGEKDWKEIDYAALQSDKKNIGLNHFSLWYLQS